MITWYVWLALIALLLKGYWWIASRKYAWADNKWYLLIGAFTVQNASEFFAYDLLGGSFSPEHFIYPYYASILFVPVAMFGFIRNDEVVQRYIYRIMVFSFLVMSGLVIFTSLIISGYEANTYPIKSIKGDWFSVYLAFALSYLLILIATVAFNFKETVDPIGRLNQVYAMRAFLPFVLVALCIVGGMLLGYNVNGSGLFPIASTLFMLITIQQRCKSTYLIESDPRASIPFSSEWTLTRAIAAEIFQCIVGNRSLAMTMDSVEGKLLNHHCRQHLGSKSSLAKKLGVSRPTLDRKMERHNIEIAGLTGQQMLK